MELADSGMIAIIVFFSIFSLISFISLYYETRKLVNDYRASVNKKNTVRSKEDSINSENNFLRKEKSDFESYDSKI